MAHFIPMVTRKESPAKDLAITFAREIWRLHGLPLDIVSDRGSVFISGFWKELMELVLTTVRRSSRRGSPRHPIKTSGAIKYLDIYLTRK